MIFQNTEFLQAMVSIFNSIQTQMAWLLKVLKTLPIQVLFIYIAISLGTNRSEAQIAMTIDNVKLGSGFSSDLSTLLDFAENQVAITVSNNTPVDIEFFLEFEVTRNGQTAFYTTFSEGIAQSDPQLQQLNPFTITGNTIMLLRSLDISEAYPFLNGNLSAIEEYLLIEDPAFDDLTGLYLSGVLPEGEYGLCVTAVFANQEEALALELSDSSCSIGGNVFAEITQPPRIITPDDLSTVIANPNSDIFITWEHLTSAPQIFEYALKIMDIPPGQDDLEELMHSSSTIDLVAYIENINALSYFYPGDGSDPGLEMGKEYAIQVQAFGSDELPDLQNGGRSEIHRFAYSVSVDSLSNIDMDEDGNLVDECNCFVDLRNAEEANVSVSVGDSIKVGKFDMVVESGNKAKGKGIIEIAGLSNMRVKVNFGDLKLTSEKQMIAGTVRAQFRDNWFVLDSTFNAETGEINLDYLELFQEIVGVGFSAADFVNGVSLPFGVDLGLGDHTFKMGINNLEFTPTHANISLLLTMPQLIPISGMNKTIAFGSSSCLNPEGLASRAMLVLGENFRTFTLNEEADISPEHPLYGLSVELAGNSSINSPEEARENACFFEFDCNGIKGMALRGNVSIPKSLLVVENPETGERNLEEFVKADFDFVLDLDGGGISAGNTDLEDIVIDDALGNSSFDIMLGLEFSPFQLSVLDGWGFTVEEAYMDLSEIENPFTSKTPPSKCSNNELFHADEYEPSWKGIYIKAAELRLPNNFLGMEGRLAYGVEDVLIEESGISATFYHETNDFLDFDTSSAADSTSGFAFSLEKMYMCMQRNVLQSAGVEGQVGLPLFEYEDRLEYTMALDISKLEEDTISYVLDVKVGEDAVAMPFLIAEANLNPSTHIKMKYTQATQEAPEESSEESSFFDDIDIDLVLAGDLTMSSEFIEANALKPDADVTFPDIPFEIKFNSKTGFDAASKFTLLGSQNNQTATNPGEGVVKKPKVAGFPINVSDIKFGGTPTEPSVSLSVGLSLVGGDNSLGIQSNFSVFGRRERGKYKLASAQLNCLGMDVLYSGVGIAGELCFYKTEEQEIKYEGIYGSLSVGLPMINARVDMDGTFGSAVRDVDAPHFTEDNFNFFYADASFETNVGIPMGQQFIFLYGLEGGIRYNMEKIAINPLTNTRYAVNEAGEEVEPSPPIQIPRNRELKYVPKFGNFGLGFGLTLGAARPDPFLGKMYIAGEIDLVNGGIRSMEAKGTGYIMPVNGNLELSPVWFDIGTQVLFPEFPSKFSLEVSGNLFVRFPVGAPAILYGNSNEHVPYLSGNAFFYMDNYSNGPGNMKWTMRSGSYGPTEAEWRPNRLSLNLEEYNLDIGSIDLETYFWFGPDVPTYLPPKPPTVISIIEAATTEGGGGSFSTEEGSGISGGPSTGFGIAHGTRFSTEIDVDALIVYGRFASTVGYDLNLTQAFGRSCGAHENIGMNGWYGQGAGYMGVEGNVGVRLPEWLKKSLDNAAEAGEAVTNAGLNVWNLITGDDKEVDFQIQEEMTLFMLRSLVLLEAGAPAPVWATGKAYLDIEMDMVVTTWKQNVAFEFNIGEPCIQATENPFESSNLISVLSPMDSSEVNYNIVPSVTLNYPINQNFEYQTIDAEGNKEIKSFRVELSDVRLLNSAGREIETNWEINADQTTVHFHPSATLLPELTYSIQVTASGLEGNREVISEQRTAQFTIAEKLSMTAEDVKGAFPFRDQKYLLSDEVSGREGKLIFEEAIADLSFMRSLNYQVIIKNNDQSEYFQLPASYSNGIISYEIPELSTSEEYAIEFQSRKKLNIIIQGNVPFFGTNMLGTSSIHIDDNMEEGEFQKFYSYSFKTSRYASLNAKVNAIQIAVITEQENNNPFILNINGNTLGKTGNKPTTQSSGKPIKISLNNVELFEERELNGTEVMHPIIVIADPLDGNDYYSSLESKFNYLKASYTNNKKTASSLKKDVVFGKGRFAQNGRLDKLSLSKNNSNQKGLKIQLGEVDNSYNPYYTDPFQNGINSLLTINTNNIGQMPIPDNSYNLKNKISGFNSSSFLKKNTNKLTIDYHPARYLDNHKTATLTWLADVISIQPSIENTQVSAPLFIAELASKYVSLENMSTDMSNSKGGPVLQFSYKHFNQTISQIKKNY